jgi:hypothetical protein
VTGKISGTVVRDTAATGAPGALSDLAGYVFDAQGTQHVVYIGPNDHVYELWWGFAVSPGWENGSADPAVANNLRGAS